MIRKEAWPFYITISGVRLWWELEEPKGPKGRPRSQENKPLEDRWSALGTDQVQGAFHATFDAEPNMRTRACCTGVQGCLANNDTHRPRIIRYRGTSPTSKHDLLGPYHRHMPEVLGGS